MRDATADLDEVLQDAGFQSRLITDVVYDGARTMANLPVAPDWSITFDLESETKSDATLNVLYQGDFADSLTPRHFLDRLAPFGQQVVCLIEITLGNTFRETVPMLTHRINEVPSAADQYMRLGQQLLVRGSKVQLGTDDLFFTIKRNGLPWPSPPERTDSIWAELQRLSGLPVVPTLPDLPTPDVIYDTADGGRLTAIQMLATTLGGTAYTTPFGELSAVPFQPSDPVNTLRTGPAGRVLEVPRAFSSEGRYNRVIGKYAADDGTPIYSIADIPGGPLAPDGPMLPYTFLDSDDRVKTQVDADKRTQMVLARLRDLGTYRIKVKVMLDPRIEFGDVVILETATGDEIARVVAYDLAGGANTMDVTLDVARASDAV